MCIRDRTSTPLNDRTETAAVKKAFADHAYHLAMSSTKSNTGHLLGASGAIEAIITIKALQEGFIPPTIHFEQKDEDCDLDIVANEGRSADLRYAMSNSLGFGGHNASLIFAKGEELSLIHISPALMHIQRAKTTAMTAWVHTFHCSSLLRCFS